LEIDICVPVLGFELQPSFLTPAFLSDDEPSIKSNTSQKVHIMVLKVMQQGLYQNILTILVSQRKVCCLA